MVTYKELFEKFEEKGYLDIFHMVIGPPPLFDPSCIALQSGRTREDLLRQHKEIVEKICEEHWEYWNTWIDYQQYKF